MLSTLRSTSRAYEKHPGRVVETRPGIKLPRPRNFATMTRRLRHRQDHDDDDAKS
jgi:hypothetical protein